MMVFQPPPNAELADVWIAGLILAGLVWIETITIIWQAIELHSMASFKTNKGKKCTHEKRYQPTNLPKE